MTNGFHLEPATLETTAGKLRRAGTELAETQAGPQSVDAGDVLTNSIETVIRKLTIDAGEVSTGLVAAGEEVAKARQTYLDQEAAARKAFSQLPAEHH